MWNMQGSREREWGGVSTSYEYELRSLNLQTKMNAKMSQKMTIFVQAREGFDFSKIIIFESFSISFSSSFSKNEIENEIENELKMARK